MNTDELFKVLSAIHPLSFAFKQALSKELTTLSLPRNHLLVEAPKIADKAYFIEKGFAMSYSYMDGKKFIEGFWKAGDIMTSANSFYEQTPSVETIQLLDACQLFCLSHSGLLKLFEKHQETHYLYHKIMNYHYSKCRNRIHDIQRLSALQRFEKLLKFYHEIEQFASQENIASYLAITPQSLSRIKRNKNS